MKISRGRLPLSHVPVILCIDRFGLTVCQRLFVCANAYSRGRTKGHANVVVWGGVGGGGRGAAFVRCGAFAFPSRKSLTLPALSLSLSLSRARARAHSRTYVRFCNSARERAFADRIANKIARQCARASLLGPCLLPPFHPPPPSLLFSRAFGIRRISLRAVYRPGLHSGSVSN